ncbi:glutamate receptor ionotropic, NMDA 2B [Caerostris extrusa]|uniref:Glutamate receptor ionotropic, NMDA 2B n=1 Tax=Caerostris extrusa TaxID=172846 RepID=A0AAV4VIH4_CAEEX|nr:glutamate receptor ionotropic, NMDA 2B [Caerostris extrusa]
MAPIPVIATINPFGTSFFIGFQEYPDISFSFSFTQTSDMHFKLLPELIMQSSLIDSRAQEPLKTRDMTRNTVISNEDKPGYKSNPLHSYGPHFIKTSTTLSQVAEIETVL